MSIDQTTYVRVSVALETWAHGNIFQYFWIIKIYQLWIETPIRLRIDMTQRYQDLPRLSLKPWWRPEAGWKLLQRIYQPSTSMAMVAMVMWVTSWAQWVHSSLRVWLCGFIVNILLERKGFTTVGRKKFKTLFVWCFIQVVLRSVAALSRWPWVLWWQWPSRSI